VELHHLTEDPSLKRCLLGVALAASRRFLTYVRMQRSSAAAGRLADDAIAPQVFCLPSSRPRNRW
jgi:hypothetical protein